MKKKSILLTLGTLSSTLVPISVVVACSNNDEDVLQSVFDKTQKAEIKKFIKGMEVRNPGNDKMKDFIQDDNKIDEYIKLVDEFYVSQTLLVSTYEKLMAFKDQFIKLLIDKKVIKSSYRTSKFTTPDGEETTAVNYIANDIDNLFEIFEETKDNEVDMKQKITNYVTVEAYEYGVKTSSEDWTDEFYLQIKNIFMNVISTLDKNKTLIDKRNSLQKAIYGFSKGFHNNNGIDSNDRIILTKKIESILHNDNKFKMAIVKYGIRFDDWILDFFTDMTRLFTERLDK